MTISVDDKIREMKRELRLRRGVYRNLVADGTITPQEASQRIKVIEAIIEDYEAQVAPKLPV